MTGRRWFILVGGINGAGKSTFAQFGPVLNALAGESDSTLEIINPDQVTREIQIGAPDLPLDEVNLLAAEACETHVRAAIKLRKSSLAIETVLSTDKYKSIFHLAKRNGYGLMFIYVVLPSVKEAIARVAHRVHLGGHAVPVDKIRKRWPRSLANVPWFWRHSDRAFIFFNGSKAAGPRMMASREGALIVFDEKARAPWALADLVPKWQRRRRT